MALFAGIIFGEKMWTKGIWVARVAGVALAVAGMLSIAQVITLVPSHDAMSLPSDMSMSGMVDDSAPETPMEMSPAEPPSETLQGEDRIDVGQPGMKI